MLTRHKRFSIKRSVLLALFASLVVAISGFPQEISAQTASEFCVDGHWEANTEILNEEKVIEDSPGCTSGKHYVRVIDVESTYNCISGTDEGQTFSEIDTRREPSNCVAEGDSN